MNIYLTAASWIWIIWWLVWFVTSFKAKKKIQQKWDAQQLLSLAFLVIAFFLIFRWQGRQSVVVTTSNLAGVLGLGVMGVSIFFSIWARQTLGKNWSGTIVVKQDHELVTAGPYRFVRHPIYTGLLGGFIGMAIIVGGGLSWLSVLSGLIAFLIRIPAEEKIMTNLFPEQYSAYKKRTKALIPFLF